MAEPKQLKVIGAGFGRTGTLSMQAALETLGFGPCYHMRVIYDAQDHINLWEEAHLKRSEFDFEKLLDNFQSAVDWPVCDFYKELADQYPNAKVILNVRDPDIWYKSASETIYAVIKLRVNTPLGTLNNKVIWNGTFSDRFEDAEHAKKKFVDHIESVKATIPAERLLVFSVTEGWGPLCNFLNVPIPEAPFPHLNNTDAFKKL